MVAGVATAVTVDVIIAVTFDVTGVVLEMGSEVVTGAVVTRVVTGVGAATGCVAAAWPGRASSRPAINTSFSLMPLAAASACQVVYPCSHTSNDRALHRAPSLTTRQLGVLLAEISLPRRAVRRGRVVALAPRGHPNA